VESLLRRLVSLRKRYNDRVFFSLLCSKKERSSLSLLFHLNPHKTLVAPIILGHEIGLASLSPRCPTEKIFRVPHVHWEAIASSMDLSPPSLVQNPPVKLARYWLFFCQAFLVCTDFPSFPLPTT